MQLSSIFNCSVCCSRSSVLYNFRPCSADRIKNLPLCFIIPFSNRFSWRHPGKTQSLKPRLFCRNISKFWELSLAALLMGCWGLCTAYSSCKAGVLNPWRFFQASDPPWRALELKGLLASASFFFEAMIWFFLVLSFTLSHSYLRPSSWYVSHPASLFSFSLIQVISNVTRFLCQVHDPFSHHTSLPSFHWLSRVTVLILAPDLHLFFSGWVCTDGYWRLHIFLPMLWVSWCKSTRVQQPRSYFGVTAKCYGGAESASALLQRLRATVTQRSAVCQMVSSLHCLCTWKFCIS